MKIFLYILGGLIAFSGGIWFLQGISVLPGQLMGGQIEWAYYGGIAIVVGVGLISFARKRDSGSPDSDK